MYGRGKSSILPAWMTAGGDTSSASSSATGTSGTGYESTQRQTYNPASYNSNDSSHSSGRSAVSSETDNILNALKSIPSVTPVRQSSKGGVKRQMTEEVSVSRFDKMPDTNSGYLNKTSYPGMNSAPSQYNSVPPASNPSPRQVPSQVPVNYSKPKVTSNSSSDWNIFKTAAGVEYYYNQRTRATTYDKPDELKSEAELALKPCTWKEFKTADGRTYWNNMVTQISVWEEPAELKEYNEALKRIQQEQDSRRVSPANPKPIGNSPFIPTIVTTAPAPAKKAVPSNPVPANSNSALPPSPAISATPSNPVPAKQTIPANWSTESEARAAFESLLQEVVTRPNMSWKEVVPTLTKDIRYTALKTAGQRKQCFSEFLNRMSKQQKENKVKETLQAREAFRSLLQHTPSITHRSSFRDVEAALKTDPRWDRLEKGEREREFREYIQTLQQKAREDERDQYKKELEAFTAVLDQMKLSPKDRWSDKEKAVTEKFTGKVISGKDLRDLFYDYLDKLRSRQEKESKARREKAKQGFQQAIQAILSSGRDVLSLKSDALRAELKDSELLKELEAPELKLSLEEMLRNYQDDLKEKLRKEGKNLTVVLQGAEVQLADEMTMDSLNEQLKQKDASKLSSEAKSALNSWMRLAGEKKELAQRVFDSVVPGLLREQKKKSEPAEKKLFKSLLDEYLYEKEHLVYTYEDVEPQLKEKKRWQGVKSDENRKEYYAEFMQELKVKLEKKKERKEKEKESKHRHHSDRRHHSRSRR